MMTNKCILSAIALALVLAGDASGSPDSDRGMAMSATEIWEEAFDIVQRREAKALLRHMQDDVMTGFGVESGKAYFIHDFQPENPTSPVWNDLITILAMARPQMASQKGGSTCYPSQAWSSLQLASEFEREDIAYPIGSATGLWSEASVDSHLVVRTGVESVLILGDRVNAEWQRATILNSDLSGYVRRSDIRLSTDRVLCIYTDGKEWTITRYIFYGG